MYVLREYDSLTTSGHTVHCMYSTYSMYVCMYAYYYYTQSFHFIFWYLHPYKVN